MTDIAVAGLKSFTRLFVGGEWVEPSTDVTFEVRSPYTEVIIASAPAGSTADIDVAVAAAREAFDHGPWPRMSGAERGDALDRIADALVERAAELTDGYISEVGSTVGNSYWTNQMWLPDHWRKAAALAREFPYEQARSWDGGSGHLVYEATGVVAAIVPWNGPVFSSSMKLATALASGCTVVLKPAPEAPITPLILAEAIAAAGLPPGVVSVIPGDRDTGEHLVKHADVDHVTFTGSTVAGRRIMSLCADRIARVTLELGGKSAALILDDVSLDQVLPSLVPAGVGHSGQVCAAITRVLVPRARQEELINAMAPLFEALTIGDPADPATDIGPLVAERQRDRVEEYIKVGIGEGARLVTGGGRPAGFDRGWFVQPTLFADVTNDMRIAREEIFGPVICVLPFDDVDEAITMANDSEYGLSGAVYARDVELANLAARRLRTGQVTVNSWSACTSEPWGGYKQSGFGREGTSREAMESFMESKLILEQVG